MTRPSPTPDKQERPAGELDVVDIIGTVVVADDERVQVEVTDENGVPLAFLDLPQKGIDRILRRHTPAPADPDRKD